MSCSLTGRSFLKLLDFSPDEIRYLLDLSSDLKRKKKAGISHRYLEGKNIALIFEKPSTRTRCSFEVAARDLGMGTTFLDASSSQIGMKESVRDTARVLGRLYDGIEYRGFRQESVEELARFAGVPVWNGLTDEFHPTQMLADLLTIEEHKGCLNGLKLTFFGDARNNVANSLMVACAKMGIDYTACAPETLFPSEALVKAAREAALSSGSTVTLTSDKEEGARNADVLCTDAWLSMGEDKALWAERIRLLSPYRVDGSAMELASKDALFMHCLPSFHNTGTFIGKEICEKYGLEEMEVSDSVFESPASVVFDEAENRMHTIKAVMLATLA